MDCQKKNKSFTGHWTKAQNSRFINAYEKHGKNWSAIQKDVKTRTIVQIRSHAQKVFHKYDKHDIEALFEGNEKKAKNREIEKRDKKKNKEYLEMTKQLMLQEEKKEEKMQENTSQMGVEKITNIQNQLNERFKEYRFGSNFINFLLMKEERMKEKQNSEVF